MLQVVYQLRQSCGAMGESELGKMAVALLNCQSEAENRPTFACTSRMVRVLPLHKLYMTSPPSPDSG